MQKTMRRYRIRKKYKKMKWGIFFVFSIVIVCMTFIVSSMDSKILPPILAIVEKTAKNKINYAIDHSIQEYIKEEEIESNDFFVKTTDNEGMIISLSVNTVLVNELCSQLAVNISKELEEMKTEKVKIPIGTLFDMQVFSNVGPGYPISVLPIGNAVVDYETKFESVGINQVNFQLWLKVESAVKVANPVQEQDFIVSRKIALVNTVFSGKVPETYLNNIPSVPLERVDK